MPVDVRLTESLRLAPAMAAFFAALASAGAQEIVLPPAAPTPAAQPVYDPAKELRTLNALYIGKEYAQAAAGYIDFLRQNPAAPAADEVYYKLGDCYRQLGRTADAVDAFNRLLKEAPKSPYGPFALARKGEVLLDGGQAAEALAMFDQVIGQAESPGLKLNAKFSKVRALRALGRAVEAVPLLEELAAAEENNPYRAYAALALARHHESAGRSAQALRLYQLTLQIANEPALRAEAGVRAGTIANQLKDWNEAASLFETIRRLSAPELWKRYANMGLLRARFAAAQYDAVLELYPEIHTALPPGTEAEALYAFANAQRLRGRLQDAAGSYTRLLDANEKSPYAEPSAYERVLCLSSAAVDELGVAAEAFLKDFPGSDKVPAVRYVRANFLFDRRQFRDAIPLLQEIVREGEPKTAQETSLFRLGWAQFLERSWQAAVDAHGKLLDLFPDTRFAPDALWEIGAAHEQLKNPRAALAAWAQLAERFPETEQGQNALFQMGVLECREKQYPESRRHFTDFLKRHPSSPRKADALFWRGSAAFEAGDYAAAVPDLRAAREAAAQWYGPATEQLLFASYRLENPEELARYVRDWDVWLARHPGEGRPPDPAILLWLGKALAARELWEDAEIFLVRVADDPARALRPEAQLGAGDAQLRLRKFASAVRTYETFRTENPERAQEPRVMLDLAHACVGAGRASDAFALAEAVMRDQPEGPLNAEARLRLGDALMAMNRPMEAAKYYSSVTLLYDLPALTLEALAKAAEAHEKVGNAGEAEKFRREWRQRSERAAGEKKQAAPNNP